MSKMCLIISVNCVEICQRHITEAKNKLWEDVPLFCKMSLWLGRYSVHHMANSMRTLLSTLLLCYFVLRLFFMVCIRLLENLDTTTYNNIINNRALTTLRLVWRRPFPVSPWQYIHAQWWVATQAAQLYYCSCGWTGANRCSQVPKPWRKSVLLAYDMFIKYIWV